MFCRYTMSKVLFWMPQFKCKHAVLCTPTLYHLEKKVVQSSKIIDILCIDLEVAPGADSTLHAIGGTFQRGNIAEA